MTNVQTTSYSKCCNVLLALSLGVALSTTSSVARAQSPFVRPSGSGAASEVIDANRRAFGMNFRSGHTAGDAVGRQDSITHMSLSPYFNTGPFLVFSDARLGRANVGGLTWSFGAGLRTFVEEWDVVTGANIYHSGDNITGTQFRTWGMGVEVLREAWEVRANYVRPNGNSSALIGQALDESTVAFSGNNIIFDRYDTIAEALEKFDMEVGMRLSTGPIENVKLRGFVGAYRYSGVTIPKTTGWKTRLQAEVGDHLELGVGLNQDTLLETMVTFNAAVTFGGFEAPDYTKRSAIHRLAEPVRRDPTVASIRRSFQTPGAVAIDPSDGMALQVVHVDVNNGGGTGTVDDPLSSITTGLALPGTDLVFVHAGGVYDAAPDNTVSLAADQNLFGEGVIPGSRFVETTVAIQGLGELQLPDSPTFIASGWTLERPTLQDAMGDSVTLGSNSRFGGFIVDGSGGAGITSDGAGETVIRDVLVQNTAGAGIFLENTTGTTTIIDTIISDAAGPALHVDGGDGFVDFRSNSVDLIPAFSHIENSSQQAVLIENMLAGGFVSLTGTTISDTGGTGIDILNNAGGATIDNAQIVNSDATGIRILNSSGAYNFTNSLESNTLIEEAAAQSVLIDGLAATGQVTFSTLVIDSRNDAGIEINDLAGSVRFLDDVTMLALDGGAAAGLSVSGSQADSSIRFSDLLSITDSGGRGIELINSQADSLFSVQGQTAVRDATLESIFMDGVDGTVELGDFVTIENRLDRGLVMQNSNGDFSVSGATFIGNALGSATTALDIQNSEANVTFNILQILDAEGVAGSPAGVNLVGNLAGATNTALHTYGLIDIRSSGGVGFFANNNTNIRILDGTINSGGAAAISLEESAWTVELESVSSQGSPDNGIRLVNAVAVDNNTFIVDNQLALVTPGDAGTIEEAGTSAALLQNAGQVRFRGMLFDDNNSDIVLTNSGLAVDDDQVLEVLFSAFTDTQGGVVDAQNLTTFVFEDSVVVGGDNPNVFRLVYDELANDPNTTTFGQFNNPYQVFMRRNVIDNNTNAAGSTILIESLVGAAGAHLDVDIDNNLITQSGDGSVLDQTTIEVDWTGPSRIRLAANQITNAGTTTAYRVTHRSTTDEMLLSIIDSRVTSTDDNSIGLNLQTSGESDILIDGNEFTFAGVDSTGMQFNLAPETELFLLDNQLRFDADGGTGMFFTLVSQPSAFTINDNEIGLFDNDASLERGMIFQAVIGSPLLTGTQNNRIFLLNPNDPNAFLETVFSFGGTANGQILVNGAVVP